MKVLICSTGLAGHFNPLVPFIEAARTRGDEVLVVVPRASQRGRKELGLDFTSERPTRSGAVEGTLAPGRAGLAHPSRAAPRRRVLRSPRRRPRCCRRLRRPAIHFKPDVILREPCAYAGAVEGVRRGNPSRAGGDLDGPDRMERDRPRRARSSRTSSSGMEEVASPGSLHLALPVESRPVAVPQYLALPRGQSPTRMRWPTPPGPSRIDAVALRDARLDHGEPRHRRPGLSSGPRGRRGPRRPGLAHDGTRI